MTEIYNEDLRAFADELAENQDQTSAQEFTYEPIPDGTTYGRLIEYVELGKQPRPPYQGKPREPADEVRIVFELLTKKHIKEVEVEGVKKKVANRIVETMLLSSSPKSKYRKLLDAMANGRKDIKHMAQMLGEAFRIHVVHNVVEKEGKKTTYANIYDAGAWKVSAPTRDQHDEDDNVTQVPVAVPAPLSPLKLFSFIKPTQKHWDSLKIEGTYTVKDDKGVEKEVSKNKIQEKIKGATNFKGSALEAMLSGITEEDLAIDSVETLEDLEDDLDSLVVEEKPKKAAKAPATTEKKTVSAEAAKTAAAESLADLGLDLDE